MDEKPHSLTIASADEADDDELLLLQVYSSDDDIRGAEEALTSLYTRHAGFLEAVCRKYHWEHPTRPARDFVNEAFVVVFRERPAFQAPREASPESRRRAVRNFLCGICRLRYLKFYEKLGREPLAEMVSMDSAWSEQYPAEVVTPDGLEGEAMAPTPPARTAIRRFFDSLEEENRIILTHSAPFIDLATGRCIVPPREARALSAMVNLELPAIRQRRKRMLDQIRKILADLPQHPMKSP